MIILLTLLRLIQFVSRFMGQYRMKLENIIGVEDYVKQNPYQAIVLEETKNEINRRSYNGESGCVSYSSV